MSPELHKMFRFLIEWVLHVRQCRQVPEKDSVRPACLPTFKNWDYHKFLCPFLTTFFFLVFPTSPEDIMRTHSDSASHNFFTGLDTTFVC